MHPLQAMFFAALFGAGSLKFGIAFEIASTPVKAELPDANALNSKTN